MTYCPASAQKPFLSMAENVQSFIDSSFVIDTSRQHSGIDAKRLSTKLFRPPACRTMASNHKLTREMRQAWDAVWLFAAVIAQGNRWNELIKAPLEFSKLIDSSQDQRIYLIPRKHQTLTGSTSANESSAQNRGAPLLIDCLSGPLILEDGARRPVFRVYQIQNSQMFPVMVYHPLRDTLSPIQCEACRELEWRMGRPPKDSIIEHIERHTTPLWLTALVFFATGCGTALAISFFIFTIANRKERIIKLSAPSLTAIFAIGSAMLYLLLPFLSHSESFFTSPWDTQSHVGIDETGGDSVFKANVTCLIRYLLLFCGFSCTFCSVALRTYKIYIATTSLGPSGLKKQLLLRDERLLIVVGGIIALDIVLVVSWSQVVGFSFHEQNETKYYDPEMDQLITYQSIECSTPHSSLFFAVCCSWKLLIISFGLFLAWRIHGVKIKVLNDAKFIGAISYIIVISALVVIVIHMVNLSHSGVATYLLDVSIVISANTICLLLNFLPKVMAIHRRESAVLCSDLFVEQGGTRRFNTDFESQHINVHGIETQNSLLKGELAKLTTRVEQLEHLLEDGLRLLEDPSPETVALLQSLSPRFSKEQGKEGTLRRILKGTNSYLQKAISPGSSLPNFLQTNSPKLEHKPGRSNIRKGLTLGPIDYLERFGASSDEKPAVRTLIESTGRKAAALHQIVGLERLHTSKSMTATSGERKMAEIILERELNDLDAELRRALTYSLKSLANI